MDLAQAAVYGSLLNHILAYLLVTFLLGSYVSHKQFAATVNKRSMILGTVAALKKPLVVSA